MLGKIMKKIVMMAGLSLAVVLLAAMAAPAKAQMDVGVEVGDWFKYEVAVTEWESEEEFLWEGYMGPLTLADNETNFILYTVTDITPGDAGANVTFEVTYDWKNGTVTYADNVQNVSTANTQPFIIGANMTEGELVIAAYSFFGTDMPDRNIDETFDLENPNATRATNSLAFSIELFSSPYDYEYWWDQETGMRVYYMNHAEVSFGTPYTYTVEWRLEDSSVDGLLIPDLTGPILLLTIMSITVPVALLHRRRKRVI
jgi:hypothetical protein